jgi:hypothetical protein
MAGGSKTTTTTSEPWAEQKDFLKKGFARAENLYAAEPRGPAYYPSETLAGFDPAQAESQRMALGYAAGGRPAEQQRFAEGNINQMQTGMVDDASFNPQLEAMRRQMTSRLTGSVLPGIRQSMVQYQPGGSSRGDQVQSQAIAAANQQFLNKEAEMRGQAYEAAQGRRVNALNAYPSIMSAPLGMSQAVGDVGAARRGMSQEAMNRDIQRYQYESQAPQTALNQYMANISGDYGGTSTQNVPGSGGDIGSIMGAVLPALISDERLKENIEPIGEHKGFKWYSYNYIWSPEKFIGVLAQEVEKILPEAVVTVNGVKAVRYGMIV